MVLQYLQKLKDNPEIEYSSQKIRGFSEQKITEYEEKLHIQFPLAYREFLYLAGDYPGYLTLLEGHSGIEELADPDVQSYLDSKKKKFGINIKRPYWVFTEGADTFLYFYLDENTEDPKVWVCEWWTGEVEIGKYDNLTFSQYINSVIDYSKKYYRESYE